MISASLVKDLRERTGAGMMDCKKALAETNGDFEAAIDWLRAKGLAAAAKKSGRIAAEGLTALAVSGLVGAVVEVNSETDFVARNDIFQSLVASIAKEALKHDDLESLNKAVLQNGKTVAEEVISNVATIGENLNLRRMMNLSVKNGVIVSYVHNTISSGMGKISVLVALESDADKSELEKIGKQIAMHIAAARPQSLSVEDLNQELVNREREIFAEQSRASGKPENIIEKMIEGRIRKFYEEVVLLEQLFVIDGKSKIRDVIAEAEKTLGKPISLTNYARFEIGEGIETQETDFAEEVAALQK